MPQPKPFRYMHIHDTECTGGTRSFGELREQNLVLKDTSRVDPYPTIRIACRFTDYTGVYMIHCHMLEHEDNAMMAQFLVLGGPPTRKQVRRAEAAVSRAAARWLKQAGWSWKDLRHKLWLLCHLPEVLPPGSHTARPPAGGKT